MPCMAVGKPKPSTPSYNLCFQRFRKSPVHRKSPVEWSALLVASKTRSRLYRSDTLSGSILDFVGSGAYRRGKHRSVQQECR
ncbi:hypothetical protein BAUCODRAFT_36331 [Baudoinia panamericana UAMH 10762]|uniref:Uncharacterized protein n=1 Tax=Baudoinia panamericana (strain UAMH 10762) TaxID=717646 RepID=M2N4C6_BAUPA|nr:uncharacterized protein BAUCODRAFT_36331 [Baudoinia panamericana UAMH 10762]EMC93874.1 hypothetical protein BAUCODRAFT_36331 [Baudoinia panamericana UAMH 10762]